MDIILITLGLITTIALLAAILFVRVVIFEHEQGTHYRAGKFVGILKPGAHWLVRPLSRFSRVDLRERLLTVPGQEVLTSDQIGLKVSLAVTFAVVDPAAALHRVEDYVMRLYTEAQLALRARIGAVALDQLLAQRVSIGPLLVEDVKIKAAVFGLDVRGVEVKDVMLPAEVRKAHSEVVRAQKEGQAAIERVRTETASLRSLANAAKLMEEHPSLYQLRLLQAASSGSQPPTIVLNAGDHPVNVNTRSAPPPGGQAGAKA